MKGLQKLERIKKLSCVWDAENDEFKDAVEIVPNAFKTIEKELKALEILRAFDFVIEDYTKELNGSVCVSQRRIILDNEEIDLLKEVLL